NGAGAKAATVTSEPPAKAHPAPAAPTPVKTEAKPAPPPAAPAATSQTSSGLSEFILPELGENVHQGDLVRLMVAPGAKISEGQPVMELETDKAVVEVPSTVTGVVKEVKVKEGEKIKVGQLIFTVEGASSTAPAKAKPVPVEHGSEQHDARV